MDHVRVKKAYARWEPVYDWVFGDLLAPGRHHAIELLNASEGRVLEVGVGTGISLPHFKPSLSITGIDLSPQMLKKARERVFTHGLPNVSSLLEMDASRMAFPDNTFDSIVAMYVLTAVPDPIAVMREIERVCKPGGQVVVVNHFRGQRGVRSTVERLLRPMASALGWRPDFPQETLMVCPSLTLCETVALRPFGLFTLLRFRKEAPPC